MRRRTPLPLLAALALTLPLGCEREPVAPTFAPRPDPAISDARHGEDGNPGFFWLSPIVAQPSAGLLGTFAPLLRPTVQVVCHTATLEGVECDPSVPLAEFGIGGGITVDAEKYQVDIDVEAVGLRSVAAGDTTTYRILVLTDSLVELGGPFLLGYADIQVGSSGREAKNLDTGEVIGLVDGRALPVKFRIDEGAYEHELKTNLALAPGDPGGPLCQENCTVQVVPNDEATEVSLEESESGQEVTGVLFEAGDLATTSIVVIDEKRTDGEDADCATGVHVQKRHCYRYKIFPDVSFEQPVRFGICPRELPIGAGSPWTLLKVDYDAAGEPTLTRPDPADVADFLPCAGLGGLEGSSLRSALLRAIDWLVPPLHAATEKVWGGMANDFSDMFWGIEAAMTPVSAADTAVAAGDTIDRTVVVHATSPEPDEPLADAHVVFEITDGAGSLAAPGGSAPIAADTAPDGRVVRMTLASDGNGEATVRWTAGPGQNALQATSPHASTSDGEPILFTATAGEADLTVPELSAVVVSDTSGANTWLFTASVLNLGPAPSGASSVGFTAHSLQTGERISRSVPLAPLDAGSADTVSASAVLPAGTWELTALANPDSAVAEEDYANNARRDTITAGLSLEYAAVTSGLAGNWSCGLTTAGQAYCWGENSRGQLGISDSPLDCGNGTFPCELRPRAMQTSLTFAQIDAGAGHGCGVDAAGKAWCWGMNTHGQLGVFDGSDQPAPVAVLDPLDPVTGASQPVSYQRVSAGGLTTCGLTTEGRIFCWGYGGEGMAGRPEGGSTPRPRQVSTDSLAGAVFTDLDVGYSSACALGSDGRVYCWGDNRWGQIGQLTGETCAFSNPCASIPTPVQGAPTLTGIAVGFRHACGVDPQGDAWCWGENVVGTVGSPTSETCTGGFPCTRTPQPVSGTASFAEISSGFRHVCALTPLGLGGTEAGQSYCWGNNQSGGVGDGTTITRFEPFPTAKPVLPSLHTVAYVQVSGGNAHMCALTAEAAIYCWGAGHWGELGRGEDPFPAFFTGKYKPARIFEPLP